MKEDDQEPAARPLKPGTITKLGRQKKNTRRVSVYLDGEFAFGAYEDVVFEHGLQTGRPLSVEEQQAILNADRLLVAKTTAMNYVAHRARTEHEVRQKLYRSGTDEATADQVVARLYELDYLDDGAYAMAYAQGKFRSKGYGPERVRNDLRRRGIEAVLVEAAVEEVFNPDEVLEAARAQAAKRWPRLQREPDVYKRRSKLFDFLLRRGFSYDTARQVVEEIEREAEE